MVLEHGEVAGRRALPCFDDPLPLERPGISPRGAEVLFWIAQGKANGDIAAILDVALPTVKTHVAHTLAKPGMENRTTAVVRALETMVAPA